MLEQLFYLLGDVHANFRLIDDCIDLDIRYGKIVQEAVARAATRGNGLKLTVLQLGDMGLYWPGTRTPHVHLNDLPGIEEARFIFIPGNHENFDAFDALVKEQKPTPEGLYPCRNMKDAYYAPFGTCMEISPGINALLLGKSTSIDKMWRKPHVSWWPQEEITETDMRQLPQKKIDVVFAHTCPNMWEMPKVLNLRPIPGFRDTCGEKLDLVYEEYKPKFWLFAHWHLSAKGMYEDCQWRLLDCLCPTDKTSRCFFGMANLFEDAGIGMMIKDV